MNWTEEYKEKILSTEAAAAVIENGDRIFLGGFGCFPSNLANAICRHPGLRDIQFVSSNNVNDCVCMEDTACFGRINYDSIFMGKSDRRFYAAGNVRFNPVHFSNAVRAALDVYKVNVFALEVPEPDADGSISLGIGGTAWRPIMDACDKILLQINRNHCYIRGPYSRLHVRDVTALCRCDHPLNQHTDRDDNGLGERVAAHIIPYIPDGATLQIGIGAISNAVGFGLRDRKNLAIHSEVLTDSIAYLVDCGAVDKRKVTCAFGLSTDRVRALAASGIVRFLPIDQINNPWLAGQNPDLFSINSCLMADLTGQVCSESIGARQHSGTGGQADFVRAAAISKGGKSFLCLPSEHTDAAGNRSSTIMPQLPVGAIVTTTRADVMYIATEWGVADLFCRPLEERAAALIGIAHPRYRQSLLADALASGLIRPETAASLRF